MRAAQATSSASGSGLAPVYATTLASWWAASEQIAVESTPPRSQLTNCRPQVRAATAADSACRSAAAPSAIGITGAGGVHQRTNRCSPSASITR